MPLNYQDYYYYEFELVLFACLTCFMLFTLKLNGLETLSYSIQIVISTMYFRILTGAFPFQKQK